MNPLDLVKLTSLMGLSSGKPETVIGLIDGPVAINHPDLAKANIRGIGKYPGACSKASNLACRHGTFVAGILCASRGSSAPAICPNCTMLVRPIFTESPSNDGRMPSATPEELSEAIVDCITGGARVINLSAALSRPTTKGEQALEEALDFAASRGVIIAAAAGNQGAIGSTAITRHQWVVPVVGCDLRGRPLSLSNLGGSIGVRGLCAPGEGVTSLATNGEAATSEGTSVAAPFVTGAIALLWSEFLDATAGNVRVAAISSNSPRQASIVPPVLDAWTAYQVLGKIMRNR